MIKFDPLKLRGVVILEFAALLVLVAILGFLGLNHVNNHQRLASTNNQIETSAKSSVTSEDVRPIVDTASLEGAAKQLDALEVELAASNYIKTLTSELNTIAN